MAGKVPALQLRGKTSGGGRESGMADNHSLPAVGKSGASTERSNRDDGGKDAWELRRVIGENRKWRERCERLEWERDHARGEAERLADELAAFTERWHEREEGVAELQETMKELQRHLAEAVAAGVHTDGAGMELAKKMLNEWKAMAPHPATPLEQDEGARAITTERFSGRLKGTLEYQRIVARRSQKYTDLSAAPLSLTPREASRATFGTHMSERVAFQAGQVLKEQIKAQNRQDYLNSNLRMFGSVDLLVQVKISEMTVEIGDAPRPNISRLATVCDLFDKVAATSEANYVALNLLRDELYGAIYEGYGDEELAKLQRTAPSLKRARQLSSFQPFQAERYASATPFFVQVARLRTSLATAESQLAEALMHSGNKTRRMQLATHAVDKLARQLLDTLLAHAFYAWTGACQVMMWNCKVALSMTRAHYRRKLMHRATLGWYRVVVVDKADTARRHVEREARKTEVYRQEAIRMARDTNALGKRDMMKQEIRQISNAWESFAVSAASELLKDTKRMVDEMCLPNLQDARVLLRPSESAVGSGMLDSLLHAPAEEWLLRWCEYKVDEELEDWEDGVMDTDVIGVVLRREESAQRVANGASDKKGGGEPVMFGRKAARSPEHGRGGWKEGVHEQTQMAQWALSTAQKLGLPPVAIDVSSLSDESDWLHKVYLLVHLFLNLPGMKFAKAESLRAEYAALESSFSKLEEARALYVDGMDPVCKMVITTHRKIQNEYRDIIRAFAVFNHGKKQVQKLFDSLDRNGRGIETESVLGKVEVQSVQEINTNIHLRMQRVMTVHSSKGVHPDSMMPSGAQSLVAFVYVASQDQTPEAGQTSGQANGRDEADPPTAGRYNKRSSNMGSGLVAAGVGSMAPHPPPARRRR